MDLLQTVRKEGSRGGRADFKWEDVKADQHRENYLGHSLMAPVGRWQKNRDLNWYAKSEGDGAQQTEAEARKEEIRRVKEAEADALARALGYDVPVRPAEGNANMTQLGDRDTQKLIKESIEEEAGQEEGVKGIGFGGFTGTKAVDGDDEEIMEGANTGRGGLDKENGERIKRDIRREERRRSRSTDGERRRYRGDEERRTRHRTGRSRSRSRDRRRRSRTRDKHRRTTRDDRERDRDGRKDSHRSRHSDREHDSRRSRHEEDRPRRRSRSRSPYRRQTRPDRTYD